MEYTTYHYRFYFTTPNIDDFEIYQDHPKNPYMAQIIQLLKKYNIEYKWCDTIPEVFNENRDWIETQAIECRVEWNGKYPIGWSDEDLNLLDKLDYNGNLFIVTILED